MKQQELFTQIETHLLMDDAPSRYIGKLPEYPLFMKYPFTLLADMVRTEQEQKYHPEGNVWIHTMMVVDEAAKLREKSKSPLVLMWAALLHDIGKPSTTRRRKGRWTSYDHDTAGARLTEEFLGFFGKEKGFVQEVADLVRYHMHLLYAERSLPYMDMKGMKQHADVEELALLGYCDRVGRGNSDPKEEAAVVTRFYKKFSEKPNA